RGLPRGGQRAWGGPGRGDLRARHRWRLAGPHPAAAHRSRGCGDADRATPGGSVQGGGHRPPAPRGRGLSRGRPPPSRTRPGDRRGRRQGLRPLPGDGRGAAGAGLMEAARTGRPLPATIDEATRHQPRARAALAAALTSPGHAYIFRGPSGSGKAAAARAFAAELLADGAPDPGDARRRALLDPSPHPDLVRLRPPGAQHLVDDVRESVIRAASLSPAEGLRRAFVLEAAEELRDESQNALLKTLEEPAPFAHLILVCSEPEMLTETILSRCAPVEFGPLAPEAVLAALGAGDEAAAAARLSGGDMQLAGILLGERGRALRATAE